MAGTCSYRCPPDTGRKFVGEPTFIEFCLIIIIIMYLFVCSFCVFLFLVPCFLCIFVLFCFSDCVLYGLFRFLLFFVCLCSFDCVVVVVVVFNIIIILL